MEIETVSCPVCYSEFDQASHLPRILPTCGHTVCSACLKIILKSTDDAKCPLDKTKFPAQQTSIEAFLPNFMLNQVISSQVIHGICSQHNEPMRLVCLTDKCLVCDECVYEGEHKAHSIKPVKKFKTEIDQKRSKLETSLDQVDSHSKQLVNLLEKGRLAMSQIVENRFKKIKLALSQKELEFSYEINSFFNHEKDRVEKLFGVESTLRASIAEKIAKQKNFLRENIFDILEEDISKIANTLTKVISKDCIFKLDQGLNNLSTLLDGTMSSQPDPLPQWQFPIKDHLSSLSDQYLEISHEEPLALKMKENLLKAESCLDFHAHDDQLIILVRENMANVAVEINDWKHIQHVTLDLERYDLSDSDFETLYYIWNKLESMTSLKLKFSGGNATDNDLFRLFPIFWKPKPLESLEIDLEKQPVTDKSLILFSEQILTKIPSLQNLIIRLWKTNITNNTLKAIAKTTLPALKRLESLRLCLRNTKIDDEGLLEVFTCLSPTLKCFELNIMETNTTDKSLHIFAQYTLPLLKKLDSLELLLWKTGVSDDSLSELFTNMQNVSALRLNLDSTNISNKSMEVFIKVAVPHMKALKELKIDLNDTKIDNAVAMKIREIRNKISH